MTKIKDEEKLPQESEESKTSADMWLEFVDGTTLHGIRYVFLKRRVLIRLVWLVLLLTSGGYFIFTVYRAFNKYYSRPINTVLSKQHLKEMDLPAVTICSLSPVSRRKVFITDDDPLFESSGLNISLCAVTSGVRGNRPCGYSLLCAYAEMPNCSSQNQKDLLAVIQKSGHGFDVEKLYRTFSHDIGALMTPVFCQFGRNLEKCSAKDFVPMVTSSGMCYTFNSGIDGKVKTLDTAGVTNGFRVILDAQSHDFF